MRKFSILILSIFLHGISFAQLPIDSATKKITFTESITVKDAKKDELYARAKNLNMLRENVKKDDKAEGTYSYKGSFPVKYPAPQQGMTHTGKVNYTVTIFVKDGKYKYVITDLIHESEKGNGGKLEGNLPECNKYVLSSHGWAAIKKQAKEQMEILVIKIKANMDPKGGDTPVNTGDW
jgi:hypothetical protein